MYLRIEVLKRLNKILEDKEILRFAKNLNTYRKIFTTNHNYLNKWIGTFMFLLICELFVIIKFETFENFLISKNISPFIIKIFDILLNKGSVFLLVLFSICLLLLLYFKYKEISFSSKNEEEKSKSITLLEDKIQNLQSQLNSSLPIVEQLKLSTDLRNSLNELENQKKIILDLQDLSTTIDEKWINIAYSIFKKDGVEQARQYINKVHPDNKKDNLKYENKKQADILLFQANMALSNKDYPKVNYFYEEALIFNRSIDNLYLVAFNLHHFKINYKKSLKYYLESLDGYRELNKKYPDTYLKNIADSLANIADLYSEHNINIKDIEIYYNEALTIYQKLGDTEHIANLLNNLAIHYSQDVNYFNITEDYYQRALVIKKELASKKPDLYLRGVASTLHNLATFYEKYSEVKAEEKFYEVLAIYKELNHLSIGYYIYDIAMTLHNLANLHARNKNTYNKAENEYNEAIQILRHIVTKDSHYYLSSLAMVLSNVALFHTWSKYNNLITNAEYQESLKIYRDLSVNNSTLYFPEIGSLLLNISIFHVKNKDINNAKKEYEEAMKIFKDLCSRNPTKYGYQYVTVILQGIAYFHININDYLNISLSLLKPYPDNYLNVQEWRSYFMKYKT